jgi:hypothetical protein
MRLIHIIVISLTIALSLSSPCVAQDYGTFVGKIVAEWLDDGRKMKLIEPFSYIDPNGSKWNAPAGWEVDGASIPQIAWSIIGGPFEGKYRNASVIHDVACDQKSRPWMDVHRTFYTAMLASDVDPIKAKIMYAAVYHWGPRWERTVKIEKVPKKNVKQLVESLRANASSGENITTHVMPIRRPGGCPEGFVCAIDPNPPISANVIAVFTPKLPSINPDEFEKLKHFVESNDPSLTTIENYGL